MNTACTTPFASLLENAVDHLGGKLAACPEKSSWTWENDAVRLRIRHRPGVVEFSRPVDETPLEQPSPGTVADALVRWLNTNAQLPGGHRIALSHNFTATEQAILPISVGTELEPVDLANTMRSFMAATDDVPHSKTAAIPEAIEAWASEADVRLAGDASEHLSEESYSIKLRGFEPARLEPGDGVSLRIDACPLLDIFTDDESADESRAACALLVIGATASSAHVRPELFDGTLLYRAAFPPTADPLPPAKWLTNSVRDIVTALRLSRRELEALGEYPGLAARYLAIRKIDLTP